MEKFCFGKKLTGTKKDTNKTREGRCDPESSTQLEQGPESKRSFEESAAKNFARRI